MRPNVLDISLFLKKIALSYALVYFTRKVWVGIAFMLLTFLDWGMGLSGLIAIIVCQLCSSFFNINQTKLNDGYYTYNSLMVGIAIGGFYQFSLPFFFVLVISSILTFFITIWLAALFNPKGLPFLSLPFLFVTWILILGLSDFNALKLTTKTVFSFAGICPWAFTFVSDLVDTLAAKDIIHIYLRSLSANIFQYNDLAGLLIAIILLLSSRISFMLSIYGFFIGYLFYRYFDGNFTPLIYSYIGFNFILTAIAIGGFFIVPSARSHFLLVFAVPVTILLISALHRVFDLLALPLFSLPFNIIVLLIIRALQMKKDGYRLQLVLFQQYSPEQNHYKSAIYNKRFRGENYFRLNLPVIGEWFISQGYNGDITHKGDWQHALDFDIRNDHGKTHSEPGMNARDFYCYQAPVTAPGNGQVIFLKDDVRDNAIKEVNLAENWGNTIIIKHAEGLYSKLSHLKEGSFKVKQGDYVKSGEIVALCGNSGRSPEPHLHFQAQANPFIGSHTIPYPIAYYLTKKGDEHIFHSFETPEQNDTVKTIVSNPMISSALDLVPGRDLVWQLTDGKKKWEDKWSVYTEEGKKYLYCHSTKAIAYFDTDGQILYFTDFYGDKKSFLYAFHLSFHKVLLACYKGVVLNDYVMHHSFFNVVTLALQDLVAPFYHFTEGRYEYNIQEADDYEHPSKVTLKTITKGVLFGKDRNATTAEMCITRSGIESVKIFQRYKTISATCEQ